VAAVGELDQRAVVEADKQVAGVAAEPVRSEDDPRRHHLLDADAAHGQGRRRIVVGRLEIQASHAGEIAAGS
jgi:hypothetical protein